jgi:hypothetical protein
MWGNLQRFPSSEESSACAEDCSEENYMLSDSVNSLLREQEKDERAMIALRTREVARKKQLSSLSQRERTALSEKLCAPLRAHIVQLSQQIESLRAEQRTTQSRIEKIQCDYGLFAPSKRGAKPATFGGKTAEERILDVWDRTKGIPIIARLLELQYPYKDGDKHKKTMFVWSSKLYMMQRKGMLPG